MIEELIDALNEANKSKVRLDNAKGAYDRDYYNCNHEDCDLKTAAKRLEIALNAVIDERVQERLDRLTTNQVKE